MGAKVSKPRKGTKLQVIGAGLPRTGTASFAAALEILLDGPAYHGGTQIVCNDNDETHVKTWLEILSRTPYKDPQDKIFVKQKLKFLLDGYVACVDSPAAQFVPELMELYPDAKVICTVRDADAWVKSQHELAAVSRQAILNTVLFFLPTVRYFPEYLVRLEAGRWGELYFGPRGQWTHEDIWERHIAYLEGCVDKEKLVWFDVREGWDPLCRILGVDKGKVEGTEFPRINDSKAIERLARRQVRRGFVRWAGVVGVFAVISGTAWWLWF